ncbi:MAG: hypothetical protein RIQ97_759 [Pseudomonadota bacterium]|jgi:DNA-binding transcriptional regulator YiaG
MEDGVHYIDGGLDNVWLKAGYELKKTPHGSNIRILDRDALQRALAYTLVGREGCLTGQEFRFLRRMLGLSQPRMGALMGFSRLAVARWEGRNAVPLACDRCIRQWALAWLSGRMDWQESLEKEQTLDRMTQRRYEVVQAGSGLEVRTLCTLLEQPMVLR